MMRSKMNTSALSDEQLLAIAASSVALRAGLPRRGLWLFLVIFVGGAAFALSGSAPWALPALITCLAVVACAVLWGLVTLVRAQSRLDQAVGELVSRRGGAALEGLGLDAGDGNGVNASGYRAGVGIAATAVALLVWAVPVVVYAPAPAWLYWVGVVPASAFVAAFLRMAIWSATLFAPRDR
jgi:hypothetical protein